MCVYIYICRYTYGGGASGPGFGITNLHDYPLDYVNMYK